MDLVTQVQILDEAVWISHSANTLGKGMNLTIFPSAMSIKQGRLSFLTFVWQLVYEKENSEFEPVKLHLKTDLVSHGSCAEGLVNTYIYTWVNRKFCHILLHASLQGIYHMTKAV